MISFSLVLTCIVKHIKERIILAKQVKKGSILGVFTTTLGLSALQFCGFGGSICGTSIGIGILSSIMPSVFINFFEKYSILIMIFAIIFQFFSLYLMKCFSNQNEINNIKSNEFFLKNHP